VWRRLKWRRLSRHAPMELNVCHQGDADYLLTFLT
jgi:hypothetical protein